MSITVYFVSESQTTQLPTTQLGLKEMNLLFAGKRNRSNGDGGARLPVEEKEWLDVFGEVYFETQIFPKILPLDSSSVWCILLFHHVYYLSINVASLHRP
jgi:hypothetical protein